MSLTVPSCAAQSGGLSASSAVAASVSALATPFPRALTAADNASADEHVSNLFAQVAALKARMAAAKRMQQQAPQSQTLTVLSSAPSLTHHALPAGDLLHPLSQQTSSASSCVASVSAGTDASSPAVLSLLTTTESVVATSSVSVAGSSATSPRAEDGHEEDAVDGEVLSSVSRQVSSLASRSSSMDGFVREVSTQVAAYHTQLHQLRAQVEHLQMRSAKAEAEATRMAGEHAATVAELQDTMAAKDEQLNQAQAALRSFAEQMRSVQRDFAGSVPQMPSPDASESLDSEFPAHFFATLHGFVGELCSQQRDLNARLCAAEESQVQLRAQLIVSESKAQLWHSERDQRLALQEQVNMLQLVLASERKAAASLPSPPAAAAYTLLADCSKPASIVIPHLALHKLLPAEEIRSPQTDAEQTPYESSEDEADDDELDETIPVAESDDEEAKQPALPLASDSTPLRSYDTPYAHRSPQHTAVVRDARGVTTSYFLAAPPPKPSSPATPSHSRPADAAASKARNSWREAVERAAESSPVACADGSAFGVPSPSGAFQLLMRTPFASTSAAHKSSRAPSTTSAPSAHISVPVTASAPSKTSAARVASKRPALAKAIPSAIVRPATAFHF